MTTNEQSSEKTLDEIEAEYKDIAINAADEYVSTTMMGDQVPNSDESVFDRHLKPFFNPDMETLAKWFASKFRGHYTLEKLHGDETSGNWFKLFQTDGLEITFEPRYAPGGKKEKKLSQFDCTGVAKTLARALEMYAVAGAMANRNDWNKMIADMKSSLFLKQSQPEEPKIPAVDSPAKTNMRTIRDSAALLESLADDPVTLSKNVSAVKGIAILIRNIAEDKNPERELFGLNLRHA